MNKLLKSAERGDIEAIKVCLEQGTDINNTIGTRGLNALMVAVASNQKETAKFLIEQGIDMNAINIGGGTALLRTIYHECNLNIANLLLKKGADPNVKNGITHKTPLQTAIREGKNEFILLFLKYKGKFQADEREILDKMRFRAYFNPRYGFESRCEEEGKKSTEKLCDHDWKFLGRLYDGEGGFVIQHICTICKEIEEEEE